MLASIISSINDGIDNCLTAGTSKLYGICHLVDDDNSKYPSTKLKQGEKVTPDDRYQIIIYHRLLNSEFEHSEEMSFGRTKTIVSNQNIRTVLIFDLESETTAEDIANSIPDDIALTGFEFVNIDKNMTLIKDSDSVWEDEYSESYKDKYVKRYNIYALEYRIQYLKCAVCA